MPPRSKAPKAGTNLDLHCSLCPKNPKFSDVSHMLTHMSSKGHLSNRFKLELQAPNEQAAKNKLDNFAIWYANNNLNDLLADRLAAKVEKDPQPRQRKPKSNVNQTKISPVKAEPAPESESAGQELAKTPVFRAPVPRMHLWATAGEDDEFAEDGSPMKTYDDAPAYDTPTARRRIPNFSEPGTPAATSIDPQLQTPLKLTGHEKSDSTPQLELKGIIWPGMDLFDTATPEKKRMRNQKKDNSVLRHLEATSLVIEPAEVSYHESGEFRKSRDIFGPLSSEENSPAAPSLRKRKVRETGVPAFADASTNAPRARATRSRKAAVEAAKKISNDAMQPPPPPPMFFPLAPMPNPLAAALGSRRFTTTPEEEEEFRLTIGSAAKGKKRSFGVFSDHVPEASPGRTESPLEDEEFEVEKDQTSAFPRNPFAQSNVRNEGPSTTISGLAALHSGPDFMQASPTPGLRASPFRPTGQENLHLADHAQGRRTLSASHVYPAQVFHDPHRNPLFQHHYSRSSSYGQQQNGYGENPSHGWMNNFISPFGPTPQQLNNQDITPFFEGRIHQDGYNASSRNNSTGRNGWM